MLVTETPSRLAALLTEEDCFVIDFLLAHPNRDRIIELSFVGGEALAGYVDGVLGRYFALSPQTITTDLVKNLVAQSLAVVDWEAVTRAIISQQGKSPKAGT